jgi:hypothetical protein
VYLLKLTNDWQHENPVPHGSALRTFTIYMALMNAALVIGALQWRFWD